MISPLTDINRPPKLMNTYLQQKWSCKNLHFISIFLVQLVLEHLSMHHVLVLVDQASQPWLRPFIFVPNHVESVASVCVYAAGNYEFVEGTFLNWVDIGVDVQVNLQFEGLTRSGDPWDWHGDQKRPKNNLPRSKTLPSLLILSILMRSSMSL